MPRILMSAEANTSLRGKFVWLASSLKCLSHVVPRSVNDQVCQTLRRVKLGLHSSVQIIPSKLHLIKSPLRPAIARMV